MLRAVAWGVAEMAEDQGNSLQVEQEEKKSKLWCSHVRMTKSVLCGIFE